MKLFLSGLSSSHNYLLIIVLNHVYRLFLFSSDEQLTAMDRFIDGMDLMTADV